MNAYLVNDETDWLMSDMPEWFDPENEDSCIVATVYGLQQTLKDLPTDAVFCCPPRYSLL